MPPKRTRKGKAASKKNEHPELVEQTKKEMEKCVQEWKQRDRQLEEETYKMISAKADAIAEEFTEKVGPEVAEMNVFEFIAEYAHLNPEEFKENDENVGLGDTTMMMIDTLKEKMAKHGDVLDRKVRQAIAEAKQSAIPEE
ncbi:unnamed protein product [Bursaphelenchus xylophilus]|uniref:(pine wood nematode) hypothetical protein n=1 Tax=Bursaphelenchus xylophilus TaxID=6326 RepID=A0A1I7S0H4_BURXY|nr:unnamed protein product [Bursaphelenchus xylophilus]CAG9132259.1 unnamed protein product [Bursaphelenchus xylophilus]